MPNINDELVFVCPACKATDIEEIIDGATVVSKLVYLSPEGDHDYETTPVIEGGKIKEFRCGSCQQKIPCKPTHQDLSDWLLDNQVDEDIVEETDGVEDDSGDQPETDEAVGEETVLPEEKEN